VGPPGLDRTQTLKPVPFSDVLYHMGGPQAHDHSGCLVYVRAEDLRENEQDLSPVGTAESHICPN
jgi:hypothetical protein